MGSIDYRQVEAAMANDLQMELQKKLEEHKPTGPISSLTKTVLNKVVTANYEMARKDLVSYIEHQGEKLNLTKRAKPYADHCEDIIFAIEAKRNFPGLSSLSKSKQQEISDRVLEHFEELKAYLGKIERVENEIKMNDVRSTVWVVQSLCFSVAIVLAVLFFKTDFASILDSLNRVADVMARQYYDTLF